MTKMIKEMEQKGYTYKYNDTIGGFEFYTENEVIEIYDDEQAESKMREILNYI